MRFGVRRPRFHEDFSTETVLVRKSTKLLLFVLLLALAAFVWSQIPLNEWIAQFRLWILDLGLLGVVVFLIAYSVLTIMLAPVGLLSLSAGFAYGAWGFPLVVVSATLAATLAFLLGRYALRERVLQWIKHDKKLNSLSKAVSEEGWRVVGLLRLSPLVPFSMQNYLFSLTEIKVLPYTLATAIGIMPGTAMYVYIGSLGQAVGQASSLQWVFIAAGLIATALVAWFVAKRANQVLDAQRLEEQ